MDEKKLAHQYVNLLSLFQIPSKAHKKYKNRQEIQYFLMKNMGECHPSARNIQDGTILHEGTGKSFTVSFQRKKKESVRVCASLSKNGQEQICLNVGSTQWNCLGRVGRCRLVGEGVSLGMCFEAMPGPVLVSAPVYQNVNSQLLSIVIPRFRRPCSLSC